MILRTDYQAGQAFRSMVADMIRHVQHGVSTRPDAMLLRGDGLRRADYIAFAWRARGTHCRAADPGLGSKISSILAEEPASVTPGQAGRTSPSRSLIVCRETPARSVICLVQSLGAKPYSHTYRRRASASPPG
jgi:hypothetical protein